MSMCVTDVLEHSRMPLMQSISDLHYRHLYLHPFSYLWKWNEQNGNIKCLTVTELKYAFVCHVYVSWLS